jgi:cell division protein FtsB
MRWLVLVLVLVLLGLQYRLWFGEGSLAQKAGLEKQVAEQAARNERLAERNRVLAEEVNGLKSGLDAVEERARSDLGMIKEDETFFLVVDSELGQRREPAPAAPPPGTAADEDVVDSIPTDLVTPP